MSREKLEAAERLAEAVTEAREILERRWGHGEAQHEPDALEAIEHLREALDTFRSPEPQPATDPESDRIADEAFANVKPLYAAESEPQPEAETHIKCSFLGDKFYKHSADCTDPEAKDARPFQPAAESEPHPDTVRLNWLQTELCGPLQVESVSSNPEDGCEWTIDGFPLGTDDVRQAIDAAREGESE